jgi:hypothetical protein
MFKFFRLAKNILFDMRYGGFLGGIKKTKMSAAGACDTANSDYAVLPYIFKDSVAVGDSFVDVGCGKGRVINWWLDNFPDYTIHGIEIDSDVAKNAANRLKKYKNVHIRCGSFIGNLPKGKLVIYLFNPFNCRVTKQFADTFLTETISGNIDFQSTIFYYNSVCIDIFKCDERFKVEKIFLPDGFHEAFKIQRA